MNSSRLKRVGVVAILVALVALVWSINRDRVVDRAPAETVDTPAACSEQVAVDLTPNQQDEAEEPIVDEPLDSSTSTASEATPAPKSPVVGPTEEEPTLAGTFVLERLDGTIDLRANGSFAVVFWHPDHGDMRDVPVVNGVWRMQPPDSDAIATPKISVQWAKVGQRSVAVVSPKDPHVPIDPLAIEVRVRAVPNTMLNVVDATTRAHLGDVEIREPSVDGGEALVGDAPDKSPIDLVSLGLGMGMHTLQVRAPGFAYGWIDVICGDGTERTLALVPGGDLRVAIERDVNTTGFQLVLTRRDDPLEEALRNESEVEERMFVFDGLEPGDYVVTALVGRAWRDPILLGETRARVHAGIVTEVTLVVAAPPTVDRVDASGLLLVPAAWSLGAPEAFVELLSATADEQPRLDIEFARAAPEGDLDAFRWNLSGVIAGRYEFVLTHPPFVTEFELTSEDPNHVRLELPARGEVLVRLVDGETSERVRTPSVMWFRKSMDEQSAIATTSVALDEALDGYPIHAFVGSIEVYCESLGAFEMLETRIEVGLEPRVVELKVQKSTIVEFALLDQGKAVPFPNEWEVAISQLDGTKVGRSLSYRSAVHGYLLGGPGRYRLTFDEISGYAPIADRVIDIPTRGRMRVEVNLQARR